MTLESFKNSFDKNESDELVFVRGGIFDASKKCENRNEDKGELYIFENKPQKMSETFNINFVPNKVTKTEKSSGELNFKIRKEKKYRTSS